MDFNDTQEEAAFRAEVQAWLAANAERMKPREHAPGLEGRAEPGAITRAQAWQARKADAGWACITWPKEYGGRSATPIQGMIWNQEESHYRVPPNVFAIGHGMLGPTIMVHGTDEQKQRYLRTDAARRGNLVPAVQRAERRVRSRRPAYQRRARWRSTGSSTGRRSGPPARSTASGA